MVRAAPGDEGRGNEVGFQPLGVGRRDAEASSSAMAAAPPEQAIGVVVRHQAQLGARAAAKRDAFGARGPVVFGDEVVLLDGALEVALGAVGDVGAVGLDDTRRDT